MKTLYRPIGEKQLILIAESGFKKFPQRLEWQPIFYPVLNEHYAVEIASRWNTKDEFGNYLGFVTEFDITDEEFNKYKIQNVGASHHNELWVPAEKLTEFNDAIAGKIKIIKVFIGEKFTQLTNKNILGLLDDEVSIHKSRLYHFLETKSRKILPYSYFNQNSDEEDRSESIVKGDFELLRDKASKINSVDEAVDFLIKECLTEKYIQKIQDETPLKPIKRSINNHFGINMFLRNLFFYPKNETLQQSTREYTYADAHRGEHGEGIIGNVLWRRLNNCEVSNSPNKSTIEALSKKVNDFHKHFFADRGLIVGKMTFDELEPILEELREARKNNKIEETEKRIELLSYNFTEKQIDRYIAISKIEEKSLEDYFEEELVLSNITDKEMPITLKLKSAYFNTSEVVEKLQLHEQKD